MKAEIEVIVRAPEQAQKFECGTINVPIGRGLLEGLEKLHHRERLARAVIDWAAGYAGLEVHVHSSVEAETEEL